MIVYMRRKKRRELPVRQTQQLHRVSDDILRYIHTNVDNVLHGEVEDGYPSDQALLNALWCIEDLLDPRPSSARAEAILRGTP